MENKSFLMVKPDGVKRRLVGEIISRFESKGLQLVAAKMMWIPVHTAEQHYAEHKDKPFFKDLVEFITSGPVFAMVWQGENVVEITRQMIGSTNPKDALPGTIRGDYGMAVRKNIIHGSDSAESAEREIHLFFQTDDLIDYENEINGWVY